MHFRDAMNPREVQSLSSSLAEREPIGDQVLIIVTLLLLAVGIMMMYSSSALLAQRRYDDAAFFLKRQSMWITVGLVLLYTVSHFQHRYWSKVIGPLLCLGLALLAIVLFSPLGVTISAKPPRRPPPSVPITEEKASVPNFAWAEVSLDLSAFSRTES